MKKLMGAAAIALLLAGCNDEKQIEPGDYLFESAQITFDNRNTVGSEQGRDALQKEIVSTLNETGKGVYYGVTSTEITAHGYGETFTGSVKEGRVNLQGAWHTIKPEGDNTLRLITDKDMSCGFYSCQITLTLKKVSPDSPELRARQQLYDEHSQAWQKRIAAERDEFTNIPMPDSPGTLFSPVEGFTLKLPWRYQNAPRQWLPEGFRRQIDRLTIEHVNEAYIAEQRKLTDAFLALSDEQRLQNPVQKPGFISPMGWALRDSAQGLNLNFFVIDGKKEDIDLTRFLETQSGVIFRAQNGAVYYNNSDELQVIYLQYDEATRRYFIGLGEAKSIPIAARAFAMLRTVDARYRGKDVITLDELTLPRALQEARYQTTRDSLLDSGRIHQRMYSLLERQLEKPFRYIGEPEWVHQLEITLKLASLTREIEMILDTRSVSALMADAKKQHPEGKVVGDLFINGDSYNLYRDTGNGMTLIFTVPGEFGNRVERIMLLSVLREFDMAMLPHVPAPERQNLLKYSVEYFVRGKSSDRFFRVNEGIIDLQGDLVIATPEDGYLSFDDHNPWLMVRKWKNQEEDTGRGRKKPEVFIYNARSKLQLHVANFGELIDNRLVAGGDGNKQGLYDLNARRWLTPQAWDEVKSQDGFFIASDYEYIEKGLRGDYVRQSLLDPAGKVLATGSGIRILKEAARAAMTDGKGNISLIDLQGRVLFSHRGDIINWYPQINAYSVVSFPPDRGYTLLGIVSEQGETILPMQYGHLRMEDDRLKLWMPGMKTAVWFDIEQVKNWRDNQPLKGVPAPP